MKNQIENLFKTIKILFVIILLGVNLTSTYSQNSWSTLIDSVSTLSSPRAADLNSDGTKDIVLGGGTDSTYSNYGVVALDGVSCLENIQFLGKEKMLKKLDGLSS